MLRFFLLMGKKCLRMLPPQIKKQSLIKEEIKKLQIDGAISLELEYSPEPSQIEAWVREAYEATARLMAEAGLRS